MSNANTQYKAAVALSEIFVKDDFNTRDAHELDWSNPDLVALAESIVARGLAEPLRLTVREDGGYYVRRGHRRLSAIKYAIEKLSADIKVVPAIVTKAMDDDTADFMVASDVHASKLSPMGAAKLLRRMMERHGMTQSEAATKLGITVAYAGDLKQIANAPEVIQEAVEDGTLAATEAARLIKQHGAEDATEIVQKAIKEASEGEPEASSGGDVAADNTPAITKDKKKRVTRADTDKAATKLNKAPKNVAPKRSKPSLADIAKEGEEASERVPLADLAIQVAHTVDALIAQMQADNASGVRTQAGKLAEWLRSYQQSGYVVKDSYSGISASTTDDELAWITEPQQSAAA